MAAASSPAGVGAAPRVNLMPRAETERRARSSLARGWTLAILAALAVVAAVSALAFTMQITAASRLAAENARTTTLLGDLAALSAVRDSLALQGELVTFRADAMSTDVAWGALYDSVRPAVPPTATVIGFRFEPGGMPLDEDPAAQVGVRSTLILSSPTLSDVAPLVRTIRPMAGVIDVDGWTTEWLDGPEIYRHEIRLVMDQTLYTGDYAEEVAGVNLPKQFINLIGAVLVVGILAGGLALIALPAWNGAQATESSAREVAQTNDIYAIDAQRLAAAQDDSATIETALSSLREEIAGFARLDDVYEIIDQAAIGTGLKVLKITAADPEAWVARAAVTGLTGDEVAEEAPVEDAVTEPNTAEVAGDATQTEATETVTAASPQQQVAVTIEVAVTDAAQAVAFIDALDRGPRLLSFVDGTLDDNDGKLTVTVLALIRTED